MKKIKAGNVDLNIYDGVLGLRCSGGADSTLLLYHLAKHSSNTIYCYVLATEEWQYKEYPMAKQVVDKVTELTGNSNIIVRELRSAAKDLDKLMTLTNNAATDDNINMLYSGITKRPPQEDESSFSTAFNENSTFRHTDTVVPTLYETTYMPLANHNKRDVYEAYVSAGILDQLFPLTFSCVDAIDEHCGNCWWCEERTWAFGRLI